MKRIAFWFRRDLRLNDNAGLYHALKARVTVIPVFVFDTNITAELKRDDPRVSFIYDRLRHLDSKLRQVGSSLLIAHGNPVEVWPELIKQYDISSIYTNHDYEPYAQMRDTEIELLCNSKSVKFHSFNDQVIFEKNEVVKADGSPYTVFTPYKNQWLKQFNGLSLPSYPSKDLLQNFTKSSFSFPLLEKLGFRQSKIKVRPYNLQIIKEYDQYRNLPATDKGSYLGPHLRFGTVSIRDLVKLADDENEIFLSELIWREFFMQILYHFPQVVNRSFKPKYDKIQWLNDKTSFEKWCNGQTGYPIVDAGMRQLNETGMMHNRVRMITASFLCKHLLIDWRWGEAYFAEKLLDYELSSNNGNWQWVAGCGVDAAPYFRIFNPTTQIQKFDKDHNYIRKWLV